MYAHSYDDGGLTSTASSISASLGKEMTSLGRLEEEEFYERTEGMLCHSIVRVSEGDIVTKQISVSS